MRICRHCRRAPVTRARGLCYRCYYGRGVRALYPSTSKFARHGVEDFNGRALLPPFPTPAMPGTPEKIAILQQRASLGVELWHPDDALLDRRHMPRDVG